MKHTRIYRGIVCFLALAILIASCQKLVHPAVGNYPKDLNPPGGPLKFYAALNGWNVDSIRANFGTDNSDSYVSGGVSGTQCVQFNGAQNGYINYSSANDFANSTDFTIAFWIQVNSAQKDHNNADGILALASTTNFWSEVCVYADHEASTSDSMQLKFHFANGSGDNWDFAAYTGVNRWPGMYDGNWHHVAFVYSLADSTATLYKDGVQFDQKMHEGIAFDGNASQLILAGFQEAVGIVDNYGDNTWMSGFPGKMNNVRLYGTALAASDIQALYANKQ